MRRRDQFYLTVFWMGYGRSHVRHGEMRSYSWLYVSLFYMREEGEGAHFVSLSFPFLHENCMFVLVGL